MELKEFTNELDINLYVLYTMCECALSLYYPEDIKNKIQTFMNELSNIIFTYPKEFYNYDIINQKFTCTTTFEKYIPKTKNRKNKSYASI